MTELAGTAAILRSLDDVARGPFRRLRARLPDAVNPSGPTVRTFKGLDAGDDAGVGVSLVATREDGRCLFWLVEIWLNHPTGGPWSAMVKGEIDLDDDNGDARCVVNDQRGAQTVIEAATAIRELADVVASYPVDELLADPKERRG